MGGITFSELQVRLIPRCGSWEFNGMPLKIKRDCIFSNGSVTFGTPVPYSYNPVKGSKLKGACMPVAP